MKEIGRKNKKGKIQVIMDKCKRRNNPGKSVPDELIFITGRGAAVIFRPIYSSLFEM